MDQNIQKILEIKNKKMQKAFNQNHIELLFLDNKQELLNYLDSLLKDDQTVGVGGSMTLFETGVINYLRNKPVRFLDRYQEGLSRDEIEDVFHQSLLADVYLTSSNAIDRNGNLYNIDGNKMLGFVDDPYFKRRKVSYFMKESVPRRNKIIPGTNLYVWVNNNANTLVRLMRDMLVRYLISPETMTLYLRRDLSSLH